MQQLHLHHPWTCGQGVCPVAEPLLVAVATTTQVFLDVEPAAGKLFLSYLAWTAYATVLNAWIWNKNPRVSLQNQQNSYLKQWIWSRNPRVSSSPQESPRISSGDWSTCMTTV